VNALSGQRRPRGHRERLPGEAATRSGLARCTSFLRALRRVDPGEHERAGERVVLGTRSDVTYVTNSELGFDYLRDNLAATFQLSSCCAPLTYCASSTRSTPSSSTRRARRSSSPGSADKPSRSGTSKRRTRSRTPSPRSVHYTVDEKQKSVQLLTEEGLRGRRGFPARGPTCTTRATQWAVVLHRTR